MPLRWCPLLLAHDEERWWPLRLVRQLPRACTRGAVAASSARTPEEWRPLRRPSHLRMTMVGSGRLPRARTRGVAVASSACTPEEWRPLRQLSRLRMPECVCFPHAAQASTRTKAVVTTAASADELESWVAIPEDLFPECSDCGSGR
jgi:hypothetical protein